MSSTHGLFRAAFIALLTMSALLLFLPRQATAHAVLLSSSPAQGEVLAAAPPRLTLRFSEPVSHVVLTLVDRVGKSVDLDAVTSGSEVAARLERPLDAGTYALNWRAVSEDGHPVRAAVIFSIGRKDAIQDMGALSDHGDATSILTWAVKFGFYCCCLFGVGGVFFAFWIGGAPPGRACAALLGGAGVCAVILVGLLGVEETGSSLAGLMAMGPWTAALDSSLARSMALVAVSLFLSFAAIGRPSAGRNLSLTALTILGPGFALTGHASDAGIKWLSFAALSLHVCAACFWAGALPRLWFLLGPGRPGRDGALRRFSMAIPYSVTVIVLAGAYLASVQLGAPEALWGTAYGRVLIGKLVLVVSALLLGGFNRIWLTNGVVDGHAGAARSMRRIVAAEIALIVLVLGVTSLWRFTAPPRALALMPPVSTSLHLHQPAAMATLSFRTTSDLRFDVDVSLTKGEFYPLDPRELTLRMSSADGAIAPFKIPLRRKSKGFWSAEHVQAPCDCEWNLRLQVLVSEFDMVDLDGKIRLLPRQ